MFMVVHSCDRFWHERRLLGQLQFRVIVSFKLSRSRGDDVHAPARPGRSASARGEMPTLEQLFGRLRDRLVIRLRLRVQQARRELAAPRRRPARDTACAEGEVRAARSSSSPPSRRMRAANARAASTNVGSFEQHQRRSGVFERGRWAVHSSRDGASNALSIGCKILPLPVHVHAAAPLLVVRVGLVFALGEVQVLVVAGRLIRLDAGAADLVDEQPADRQGSVADRSRPGSGTATGGRTSRLCGSRSRQLRRVDATTAGTRGS